MLESSYFLRAPEAVRVTLSNVSVLVYVSFKRQRPSLFTMGSHYREYF
jgi:hypothetical protein